MPELCSNLLLAVRSRPNCHLDVSSSRSDMTADLRLTIRQLEITFLEDGHNTFFGLGSEEPVAEFLTVHQSRDTAQDLDVLRLRGFRSHEQENETHRLAVDRAPVDRVLRHGEGSHRLRHRRRLTVWQRKSLAYSRRHDGFSIDDGALDGLKITHFRKSLQHLNECVDYLVFRRPFKPDSHRTARK